MKSLHFRNLKLLPWPEWRELLRFIHKRLGQANLKQVAGNLTFTTVLSLVPLLAIALALFTTFPQFGSLRKTLEIYFVQAEMPPHITNKVLRYLTLFAAKANRMSMFGIVGMLISSVAMVKMVEAAVNQIWQVKQPRPFIKRHALLLALAVLGPFLFGVSLTLTSYIYVKYGGVLRIPTLATRTLSWLLSISWTMGAFSLLYIVLPNRKIRWKEAFYGGLVAAIAFEISKRAFALYVLHTSSYGVIYGTVAVVPLFLLWIYLFWMITLTGAALSATLHIIWYERWRHIPKPGSNFLDAIAVLRTLYGVKIEGKASGMDEAELHAVTGLGIDEVGNLLQSLRSTGWVDFIKARKNSQKFEKIHPKTRHWHFLANPEQITLADVYRLFVFEPEENSSLARRITAITEEKLSQSLADYFEEKQT